MPLPLRPHPLAVATTLACLLLGGCVSQAEREAAEREQLAADRQECADLGFQPDTEPFANCLLKLRELRALERADSGLGVSLGVGFGF